MSQHTLPALSELEQYLHSKTDDIDFSVLKSSLAAAAAAPDRPDNDDILDHILPDAPNELRILLIKARNSLRQSILSAVHAPEKSQDRLNSLRQEMHSQTIDGFIVPLNDEFHGEAAPAASERLKWLTGFTGSAGMATVLADKAAIFVDGRYTLQVRQEVNTDLFTPRHVSDEPLSNWLNDNMKPGQSLAYDPWLHTESNINMLSKMAKQLEISLVAVDKNPIDEIWTDRPPEPLALVVPHSDVFSGETSAAKRERIAALLIETGQNASVHTLPDVNAWLLNLRGADLPSTPFALGFSILHKDSTVDLYMPTEKLSADLIPHLGNAVRVHDRQEFESGLKAMSGKRVQIDPAVTSQWIVSQLENAGAHITRADDPCMLPKATKNKTEIDGTRTAHIRDGAAITKFLHWLSVETPSGDIDELTAERKLRSFRELGDNFKDLSFSTISGAGPNGAIVHYRATPESNRKLEVGNLYLVDSGGQYLDGTTDITRTVAIGTPTDEMKERFTLVLKGHIALAQATFPTGTSGSQLDALARLPLWSRGLDYDHGTGHGVGSYLSVHEGPQRISKMPSTVALQPGMILSNEPGYYKTGEYGIRIENLVTVVPSPRINGAERDVMAFETLTFAPIDQNAIDIDLLDSSEKDWLNSYHQSVWDKISPLVDGDVKDWLKTVTAAL
ncbi:MAG: aminopeptidase P family protein [Sneathiella sp.]|nr:aminopeptidase P family protein [Sneathiella sp.]